MFTVKKKLRPCCLAHFLGKDYPKACKYFHGHNEEFEVEVGGTEVDQYGMLVDFSTLKQVCDQWLQDNWDHTTLISTFQQSQGEALKALGHRYAVFPLQDQNTTSENMAKYLSQLFFENLYQYNSSIKYVKVYVYETPDSVATYTYTIDDFTRTAAN